MVICNIITSLVYGGAERLLVNYSNVLAEDHELHIIYLKGEPKLKDSLNRKIRIRHIPLGFHCARKIREAIKDIKPDIVHTHLGHADLLGIWACRGLPVKLFCTMHNVYFKWNRTDRIIFFLYYLTFKLHGKKCKVSCISTAVADHVHQTLDVSKENIEIIHNCVPDIVVTKTKEELRQTLKIKQDDFCLLTIGRFRVQKSIDTFLYSIPYIKNSIDRLTVVILGEGEQESYLKELAMKLSIEDVVEFRGVTLYPEDYLQCADVFVLSSVFEGLPTVVLESFRSSLPVVASDIDGVNELIHSGENGLLFPPKQEKELAEAVITLFKQPQQRNLLGFKGYTHYQEKYSIDNYVKQTIIFYNR